MSSTAFLQVVRHVVGDLRGLFVPSVSMTVYYGRNLVVNGREFNTSSIGTPPHVLIGGQPNELYTLVMFDPDAPHPDDPLLPEIVSWIVINIPGGKTCAWGREFLFYDTPNPGNGIHRIIFALYKQPSPLDGIDTIAFRQRFSARAFANKHNLGKPVAVAYFNVQREPKKRKDRE